MSRLIIVSLMLLGLPLAVCLAYNATFWAWLTATPYPNTHLAQVRFYINAGGCLGIAGAEVFGVWLLLNLQRIIRKRRRKKGLCMECGYDLTGNVSGVCPECGERI